MSHTRLRRARLSSLLLALCVAWLAIATTEEIQFRSTAVPSTDVFQLRPVSEKPQDGYLPVLKHRLAGDKSVIYASHTLIASGSDILGTSSMNECLDAADQHQPGITVYFRPESHARIRAAIEQHMDQLVGVFSDGVLVTKATIRGVFFRAMQVCPPVGSKEDVTTLAIHIAGLDMPNKSLERTRGQ
jgi:hypothetical protein